MLFLAVGFAVGPQTSGLLDLQPESPIVATLAELALFAVLFTDGMRVGWADLRAAWRLPGRAMGWGLPLTLAITAALAHRVAGLDWPEALLVGAILAPTDPVFAALVGNRKVPARLWHLLNVESGVNDGLALPSSSCCSPSPSPAAPTTDEQDETPAWHGVLRRSARDSGRPGARRAEPDHRPDPG